MRQAEEEKRRADKKAAKEWAELVKAYTPSVCGVGYLGQGPHRAYHSQSKPTQPYQIWKGMLNRCYKDKSKTWYAGCSVDRRWHDYQAFATWYVENYPSGAAPGAYQLDKDIKVPGNKVYGPEACSFVTPEENMAARRFGRR